MHINMEKTDHEAFFQASLVKFSNYIINQKTNIINYLFKKALN